MKRAWISISMPIRIGSSIDTDPGAKATQTIEITIKGDFLCTIRWKCDQCFYLIFWRAILNLFFKTVCLGTSLALVFRKRNSFFIMIGRINDGQSTLKTKNTFHFEWMASFEIQKMENSISKLIFILFLLNICQIMVKLGLKGI